MFKSIAISTSVLLAAVPAFGGGFTIPVVETPVVLPQEVAPAIGSWEGLYLGGALGSAFGSDDRVGISQPGGGAAYTPGSVDIRGATFSLQMGYRWQREVRGRQIVTGPELAYEAGGADDSFSRAGESASSELNGLLSLRWKTGVLNEAEDLLFYGSVGIAHGSFDYTVTGAGMRYDGDFTDSALTVGLGVEKRLNERASLFGEWEFRQFGKTTLTDAAGYTTRATPEHHSIRVGVNFAF
ncbi:outer membrane beta-barrel protein [Paracoccus sp. SSJ]|uniref:outer membrane protein n=1 Tax=Paracoccus sp. SSJ TaxID=3050636 RepID=UPI00254B07C2|nr:outer membrane beta-barrel protein [Paracoccus sp. SSJ]MDK8874853.1 outer membrane beta-barrel protein [Paracoccus sp. SSJ]